MRWTRVYIGWMSLLIAACSSPEPARPIAPLAQSAPTQVTAKGSSERTADDAASAAAEPPTAQPATTPAPLPPRPLPTPPPSEPMVAIRLATVPSAQPLTLMSSGKVRVQCDGDPASSAWTTEGTVTVRLLPKGWQVSRSGGGAAAVDRAFDRRPLLIEPIGRSDEIRWNDRDWPGALRLHITDDGIDLVMIVGMESYLPGVIAKELYPSWTPAAYRAQAIAARSYATVEADRWEGRRHYDMVAGQLSQAWIGATDNAKANDAVRQTRGQLLVESGSVVPAYYSSACGGRPANALGTVTDNPHHDIASVSTGDGAARKEGCCGGSSVASWKVTIPVSTIVARLRAWGAANGRGDLSKIDGLARVEVADRNAAGRPVMLRLRPARGVDLQIEAEDFRRAINAAGDAKSSIKSCDCEVAIRGTDATISGRGFGHGVGMCQHGAEAMGRAGRDERAILARYYPKASIVRAWK